MDNLIKAVAIAIINGESINEIHKIILKNGWSEEDAFLAIKAGELLALTIKRAEANKKKPSFKRAT